MDLILHEKNQLKLLLNQAESEKFLPLKEAFKKGPSHGLLSLANLELTEKENTAVSFWQSFGKLCLKEFCFSCDLEIPQNVSEEKLKKLLQTSYFESKGEKLTLEHLTTLSQSLILLLKEEASTYENPRNFIKEKFPEWEDVGKVHFHLAENPKEGSSGFIFLATYTTKLSNKKRLQHITLGKALAESLKSDKKSETIKLLRPLHKASEKSSFLKQLIESKKIYQACSLSSFEAYEFLEAFESFEKEGIKVKLPQSWEGQKPSKPKVTLALEEKDQESFVNFHALFQFRPRLTLEGRNLTKEEEAKILESGEGLIKIRGKWISLNREKLSRVLSYWEKAKSLQENGLSFPEALKILNKGFLNLSSYQGPQEDLAELETRAEGGFQQLLEALKKPSTLDERDINQILEKQLRATLRPYQKEGVKWLCFLKERELGGCLADDMGLGKTIQVISVLLIDKQRNKTPEKTSLLVVPSSLLGNWAEEIQKFAPSLKFQILHPRFEISRKNIDSFRERKGSCDLVITSYKMLESISWLKKETWNFFILDEAQTIKNPDNIQTKAAKKIISLCKLALTGTPIENKLLDLWSIFDFCLPGLLGTLKEFKLFHASMIEKESFLPLKQTVEPYLLRRLKTDKSIITDLPQKIEKPVYCLLTEEQIRLYKEALAEMSKSLKEESDDKKRKGLILRYLMKFKQICNHPSQFLSDNDYDETKSGKFFALKRIASHIERRGEKILVFTQFKEITDILDSFLEKIFKKKGCVIHGGVSPEKRKESVELFQKNQDYPYFILSLKAGGSGLNLTRANHVVHFDRWWNPAAENQASDRSFRIGQKKNVIIHKFITKGTLEEKIDHLVSQKEKLITDIIEPSKLGITEMSNHEILNLLSLREDIHHNGI